MKWHEFPDAPARGSVVCGLLEVANNTTSAYLMGDFGLLIVRCDDAVHGFVNLCPHQFLPLTHRKSEITSADGTALLCSNHGMKFDLQTGQGDGCALAALPLIVESGLVKIAKT